MQQKAASFTGCRCMRMELLASLWLFPWEEWQLRHRWSIMVVSTLVYAEPADSSRRMQAIILMYLLRMQTGCTVHIPCLSGDIPRQGQPFPLPMKTRIITETANRMEGCTFTLPIMYTRAESALSLTSRDRQKEKPRTCTFRTKNSSSTVSVLSVLTATVLCIIRTTPDI